MIKAKCELRRGGGEGEQRGNWIAPNAVKRNTSNTMEQRQVYKTFSLVREKIKENDGRFTRNKSVGLGKGVSWLSFSLKKNFEMLLHWRFSPKSFGSPGLLSTSSFNTLMTVQSLFVSLVSWSLSFPTWALPSCLPNVVSPFMRLPIPLYRLSTQLSRSKRIFLFIFTIHQDP